MRTLTLLAALAVLVLVIGSDGAPNSARRRRDSNFIHFNRDSAFGNQQLLQQQQQQLLQQQQQQQLQQQQLLQQQQQQQQLLLQQQQQLHAPKANPVPQSRSNALQHKADGSRIVFPTNTNDYEDNDEQIVTGTNSLEGLIQGDFVPGLIYTGQPAAEAAPSSGVEVLAPSGPVATAGSLPQASNPASRCILCEPGSCPVCYRLDHNGVCRHIYTCET